MVVLRNHQVGSGWAGGSEACKPEPSGVAEAVAVATSHKGQSGGSAASTGEGQARRLRSVSVSRSAHQSLAHHSPASLPRSEHNPVGFVHPSPVDVAAGEGRHASLMTWPFRGLCGAVGDGPTSASHRRPGVGAGTSVGGPRGAFRCGWSVGGLVQSMCCSARSERATAAMRALRAQIWFC